MDIALLAGQNFASNPAEAVAACKQRNECIGADLYLVGHDARTGEILQDATSCSMCRRMIINAGIKRVVVRNSRQEFTVVPVQDWIDQDDTLETPV